MKLNFIISSIWFRLENTGRLDGCLDFFAAFVDIPMSDLVAGEGEPIVMMHGIPVGVSICYEAAFGEEIIRALPRAQILANVSNDAWFGDSLAPHQHLQIAQSRALETGRYMLRATNTGISAIIDPDGQVTYTVCSVCRRSSQWRR